MRRQVNIVFRSLFILARAGSKDLCRHLSLLLFKKRQVFPFGKWREARERKRRLAGRARVASSSSQRALAKELRFSPGLERRSQRQQDFYRTAVAGSSGNNPVAFDFGGNQFSPLGVGETLKDRRDAQERWHISHALDFTNWNKSAAARILGMSRQKMHGRMKFLGMSLKKPEE